jgi:hypothetical protein
VDALVPLARALFERSVRYVMIGVAAANYYAHGGSALFITADRDVFLPADPDNLLLCWQACEAAGLELWAGDEPLGLPRDSWLAARVIERRAVVKATDGEELHVDLSLVMAGFDFDRVWAERRVFLVEDVEIPVARLLHIVESKHAAGRDKDRLFLAAHREAIKELLERDT